MTVFVMRKGRCVKKTARNANDAPFVISDTMEPTRHMASGKYHTSKHKFRQDTKDAGCVELGSEVLKPRKRSAWKTSNVPFTNCRMGSAAMTVKVLKSQIGNIAFADQVEQYRQAMLAHRFTVDVPAPAAPSLLVESCIRRVQYPISAEKPDDFVADYEIVDDLPSLDDRKVNLFVQVNLAFAKRRVELRSMGATDEQIAAARAHIEVLEDQIAQLTNETIETWLMTQFP